MCEFCHKHGEGKRWYLQASNYAEELLSDIKRRRYIYDFIKHPEKSAEGVEKLGKIKALPGFVQSVINPYITYRQKKSHYGQVVPLEECEKIFDSLSSIVRISCYCRHTTVGSEQRYCYCLSMAPNGGMMAKLISEVGASYLTGPDTSGMEVMSKEQALAELNNHEQEGLCHTVWTFVTPFIGAICNCDRTDCLAMRATVGYDFPIMFRAEYIAEIDPASCEGCRTCMQYCQFGAISYSAAEKKSRIDLGRCFGCGICRAGCKNKAITLSERQKNPLVYNLW